MGLYLVGVDHKTAPLEVRESLAVPHGEVASVARAIHEDAGAEEVLLLATCNRTELYVVSSLPNAGALALEAMARRFPGAPEPESTLYRVREGEPVARHLFRVTAGLESAILGETEIQGQVRDAHEAAMAAATAGRLLDRLGRGAVRAGKRARAETAIASGGISHGSAASQVVRRVFGDLQDRQVLVIGAGQMAAQTARALVGLGGGHFLVANRTRAHAEALVEELPDGRAIALDEISEHLSSAHVLVLAGGAEPLRHADVARPFAKRRDPVLIVDLCVPRAAEPTIGTLPGVFLYHLDAIEELVAGSLAQRREAVPAVETILAEEYAAFRAWQRAQGAMPMIRSMNAWAEEIRQTEISYLPDDVNGEVREAVDRLTRRLVQKILARPTARVVKGMEQENPELPTPDHLRNVFGLDDPEAPTS